MDKKLSEVVREMPGIPRDLSRQIAEEIEDLEDELDLSNIVRDRTSAALAAVAKQSNEVGFRIDWNRVWSDVFEAEALNSTAE